MTYSIRLRKFSHRLVAAAFVVLLAAACISLSWITGGPRTVQAQQAPGVDLAVWLDDFGINGIVPHLIVANLSDETAHGVRVKFAASTGSFTDGTTTPPGSSIKLDDRTGGRVEFNVGGDARAAVWHIPRLAARSQHALQSTIFAADGDWVKLTIAVENDFPAEADSNLRNNFVESFYYHEPGETTNLISPPPTYWVDVADPKPLSNGNFEFSITASLVQVPFPRSHRSPALNTDTHLLNTLVEIALTPGLEQVPGSHVVTASASDAMPAPYDPDTGRWDIGHWEEASDNAKTYNLKLRVRLTSADDSEQCLTAVMSGFPKELGANGVDPRADNTARACIGGQAAQTGQKFLATEGELVLWSAHSCVGSTDAFPCKADEDNLQVVTENKLTDEIVTSTPDGVNVFVAVDPVAARVFDSHSDSVTDRNTASWQTANTRLVVPGVRIKESRKNLHLWNSSWSSAQTGNSNRMDVTVGVTGLIGPDDQDRICHDGDPSPPCPPGDIIVRFSSGSDLYSPAASNNYQYYAERFASQNTSEFDRILEFEKLGTYVVDFTVAATHSDGNNYSGAQRTIFHVGPVADLEVRDGGSSPDVRPGQRAVNILAVNNGPNDAIYAKVDLTGLLTGIADENIVASQGQFMRGPEAGTGVWHLGPLAANEEAMLTLHLDAANADASVAAAISHDNDNHPYTMCVSSANADVAAVDQAACEGPDGSPTGNSWHSTHVYDWNDGNDTATAGSHPGAQQSVAIGATVSGAPVTVPEGGSSTYSISLNDQPTGDVNITIQENGSGAARADIAVDADPDTAGDQTTLTFTPANWFSPQEVTVRAVDDQDAVDETLTLLHTASQANAFSGVQVAAVFVRVDDDEPPGLLLSLGSESKPNEGWLTLNEGDSATYTVALTSQPTSGVPVVVQVDGDDSITVNRSRLNFSSGNWNQPQTVRVTAGQDGDGQDAFANIFHYVPANAGAYEFRGRTATVAVTAIDDDVPGVRVSESALSLVEGHARDASKTYTVRLNVAPAADVTIMLASDNLFSVAVDTDPATTDAHEYTLTFTPDNATIEQTVTVIAWNDDNAADETATITGTLAYTHPDPATGEDYTGITVPSVTVSVTDDETAGITLSESALAIVEGLNGAAVTGSYTVALAAEPTGSVTIGLSSDNGDVTATPSMLTFTPSGGATPWNAPQTVTVAVADDADSLPDTATIIHAVNDGSSADEYDGLSAVLKVTVEDSDVPGLTFDTSALTVEENATETYTVVLNVEPSLDVTVRISSNNSDVTVEPSTLTFTGGSSGNWNVPQTVTVSTVVDSDETDDTLRLTHRMDRSEAPEYRSKTVVLEGAVTETMVDYDTDGNGLIEIKTRQQLNAVRWDLDGNGKPDAGPTGNEDKEYRRAFPQYGNCQDSSGAPQDCAGYELVNDITLSGSWAPIGGNLHFDDYETPRQEYNAVFDGNGRTVSNLRITRNDRKFVGLFGATGSGAEIRNVGLENVNVRGRGNVGALVGRNGGGTIEHAWSTGQVSGNSFTGGLVGWNLGGAIRQSYSEAAVTGVDSSDSGGPLWSTRIAGLVGGNQGTIVNSYATGKVEGNSHAAGLAGENSGGATITNSYATGAVSSPRDFPFVAGLVGWQQGTVENSYWDTETSGQDKGVAQGGESGAKGRTTAEMRKPGTYAGWNTDIWTIREGQYPCLSGVGSCSGGTSNTQQTAPAITSQQQQAPEPVPAAEPGVTVAADAPLGLQEGGPGSYFTVALDAEPTASVVIAVSSGNPDVTVQPSSLTFTPENWQAPQTVTVSASHDGDAADDTALITVSVTPESSAEEYHTISASWVGALVTDDDSPGVILRDFYQATGGDGWTNNVNWLSSQPLGEWHGVTPIKIGARAR